MLTLCLSSPAGHVRFWLSAGRGGFGLSTSECDYASFYVMVYTDDGERHDLSKGWKVRRSHPICSRLMDLWMFMLQLRA